MVFNDLHMFNIMIGPDGERVSLLDFEAAAPAIERGRQSVAHPGFVAPRDRRGYDVDRYALACLRLALFLPVTTLFAIDRAKAAHFAEVIAAEFPVPRSFLAEAVAEITREVPPGAGTPPRPVELLVGPLAEPTAGLSAGLSAGPSAEQESGRRLGGVSGGISPALAGADDARPAVSAEAMVPSPRAPLVTTGRAAEPAARRNRAQHPEQRRHSGHDPRAARHPDPYRLDGAADRYLPARPGDWAAASKAMTAAILASATPERADRLFPGDIAQFSPGGGLGIAHGAAGVLWAFAGTGQPRYAEGEHWLLEHTRTLPDGIPLGLYDGLAGIAYVLDLLGHSERALELIRVLLAEKWQRLSSDLNGGLAGIGLVLEHLARTTGETALRERALEAAGIVAGRLAAGSESGGARRRAGLMRGSTGPALLFLRLYERTGAPTLLVHAARALQLDLDSCVKSPGGCLEVDEGWRTMPYVGDGSAGIGLVLDDYAGLVRGRGRGAGPGHRGALRAGQTRHRAGGHPAALRAAGALRRPGGMVLHLARTSTPGVPEGALAAQIDALGWYGMPYGGGLAFPGNQMMRLSMDLGTGTAGCLLALGAALGDTPAGLPFLPPSPVTAP